MNPRPQRPERCALAICATPRGFEPACRQAGFEFGISVLSFRFHILFFIIQQKWNKSMIHKTPLGHACLPAGRSALACRMELILISAKLYPNISHSGLNKSKIPIITIIIPPTKCEARVYLVVAPVISKVFIAIKKTIKSSSIKIKM